MSGVSTNHLQTCQQERQLLCELKNSARQTDPMIEKDGSKDTEKDRSFNERERQTVSCKTK